MIAALHRRLWWLAYSVEERREVHADRGHLWAEAACCVALGLDATSADQLEVSYAQRDPGARAF